MAAAALSPAQIAKEFGVHPRTIERLIYSGELPGFRVGRQFRVKRADVDAYIKENAVAPGQRIVKVKLTKEIEDYRQRVMEDAVHKELRGR